jgi:hypothetical protein
MEVGVPAVYPGGHALQPLEEPLPGLVLSATVVKRGQSPVVPARDSARGADAPQQAPAVLDRAAHAVPHAARDPSRTARRWASTGPGPGARSRTPEASVVEQVPRIELAQPVRKGQPRRLARFGRLACLTASCASALPVSAERGSGVSRRSRLTFSSQPVVASVARMRRPAGPLCASQSLREDGWRDLWTGRACDDGRATGAGVWIRKSHAGALLGLPR